MDEKDLLKVLRELQVYASPWKSVTQHSISCQTDFDENNNCEYPVIFCSQFSPEFDVQTQCNIPLSPLCCRSCRETVTVENASTQYDITSTSIDYVFSKTDSRVRPITPDGDSYDITTTDTFFEDKDELNSVREALFKTNSQPVKFIHDEDNDIKKEPSSEGPNAKRTKIHITCGLSEDEYGNISDGDVADTEKEDYMDDDRLSDDEPRRGKRQLTCGDKELFYSDDEKFWKEMKRRKTSINIKKQRRKRKEKLLAVNTEQAGTNKKNIVIDNAYETRRTQVFPEKMDKTQTSSGKRQNKKKSNIHKNLQLFCAVQESNISYDKVRVEINAENVKDVKQILRSLEADWITDSEDDTDDTDELDTELAYGEWNKTFLCQICGKLFATNHILREHIVKQHSENEVAKAFSFRCVHCERVYCDSRRLESHLSHFRGPCEICGKMLECNGMFIIHKRRHDAHCKICNESFDSLSTYMSHMKSSHDVQNYPYNCKICGKGFLYPSQLKIHAKSLHLSPVVHSGALVYECEYCGYNTPNAKSLILHRSRSHRKEKKVCSMCNKELNDLSSFTYHMKSVHGDRIHNTPNMESVTNDYSRDTSRRSAASSESLQVYKNSTHSKCRTYLHSAGIKKCDKANCLIHNHVSKSNDFKCEVCLTDFKNIDDLSKHMTLVHLEQNNDMSEAEILSSIEISYPCFPCHLTFVTADDLQAHILSVHDVPSLDLAENDELIAETVSFPEEGNSESITDDFNGNTECDDTFSLPASVVPPDVNVVEIDGVQYRVIRS